MTALITTLLGDFFALESFLTNRERTDLDEVLYYTPQAKLIQEVLTALPNYHIAKHTDLTGKFLTTSPQVKEWGIDTLFPEIAKGTRHYTYSSLIRYPLADLTPFNLPDHYTVCQPYGSNRAIDNWHDIPSGTVVLGDKGECPERMINLIGQTTILEAIEITKKAQSFIGVDSCLSIVAWRAGIPTRIEKFQSAKWHSVYYPPEYMMYERPPVQPQPTRIRGRTRPIGRVRTR